MFDLLLRAQSMQTLREMGILVVGTLAVLFSRASRRTHIVLLMRRLSYRVEYAVIRFAIMWGVVASEDWPLELACVGMTLMIGAAVYTVYREREVRVVSGIPICGHVAAQSHVFGEGGGPEPDRKPRPRRQAAAGSGRR